MKRFKNILFVVENSSELHGSAAGKARELARLNDARIKIVGVMEEGLFDFLGKQFFSHAPELSAFAPEQLKQEIETALVHQDWADIPMEVDVLEGKPFISIIQQVIRHGYDLVVKQNNESEGVDNLGMRLLRKCPCPIWLVKGSDTARFKRILGAVDVSTDNEETVALNRKILELTHSLAQRESGEAHYLYAWYFSSESMLRGPRFKVAEREILKIKQDIIKDGSELLEQLFHSTHIQPDTGHLHIIEGRTQSVIHQIIEKMNIDVLVMGTVGRTGIPGMLIGNTAESIVKDVKCSLMAVKPDGFVTPVSL